MNSEKLCKLVIGALEDVKAKDIAVLDVRKMTSVTDYMIIASGTSNRHVKALAEAVEEKCRESGHRPTGVEGEEGSEWVLLDLQDV
ncbi:MAG TPA: ribosome silencing factor, partial [Woeseiaceae bacterium]|nr:ribosome silencing factor [Woeseiaceae bacterium]